MILGAVLPSLPLYADDAPADLPPPPESGDAGLTPIDNSAASVGAELPPPPVPGAPADPQLTAEGPPPLDSTSVETPPGEETPPLTMEGDPKDPSDTEVPSDSGLMDVPVVDSEPIGGPSSFSSSNELKKMSMTERLKSTDLSLFLSIGPSYGTLSCKGSYSGVTQVATGANDSVGGLGYNAGIGFMVDSVFQFTFDFTGTPKTKSSTVDHAMFGFGPRLGFLTLMGVFGVQQGPNPASTDGAIDRIFAIGARAGLDLVLKHGSDSRVSVGLAPEVYYITPQGADGYNSMGISVSLRIYGYDNPF